MTININPTKLSIKCYGLRLRLYQLCSPNNVNLTFLCYICINLEGTADTKVTSNFNIGWMVCLYLLSLYTVDISTCTRAQVNRLSYSTSTVSSRLVVGKSQEGLVPEHTLMVYENILGNQLFELCTFWSCKRRVDSVGPLIIYTKSVRLVQGWMLIYCCCYRV